MHSMKHATIFASFLPMAALLTPVAFAQGTDYTKVEVKTTKITPNFSTLEAQGPTGAVGGTMGVLSGPEGILMVDANFAPMGDKVIAAVRKSPMRRSDF